MKKNEKEYYEKVWNEIEEELDRQHDSLWQEYQEYIELYKWKLYRIYLEFLTGDEQYY
ncbi:unnamed protein product [marine sediment metagenome]|uniref:Uncharacterized protein n=1 Tax=marine sediment metagenome TaxID=412755 RepID=X1C4M4_9ZZZZ